MTTIAVTGADGFIGLHVTLAARRRGLDVVPVTRTTFASSDQLAASLADVETIVHLAGQNRGPDREVEATNIRLANELASALPRDRSTRVIFASSTQRHRDNAYGRSKRAAEDILADATWVGLTVAEITNVFGPGSRPFHNSVVATFCHQVARGEQPSIHRDVNMELIWVVDLSEQLVALAQDRSAPGHVVPQPGHEITVSALLEELTRLRDLHRRDRWVPDLPTALSGRLYRTLVTAMEPHEHAHRPTVHRDDRGSLFECVKYLPAQGQVFASTTAPGVQRGNHYHTRKYEKFCVLAGQAVIRLRWMGSDDVIEFPVSGDEPTVVDMPVFWAHHIENVGDDELMTLFWANEIFDPDDADTWAEPVVR